MSRKLAVDAALSGYWQQAVAARRGFELGLLLGVSSGGATPTEALLTGVRVPPESEDADARSFEDVSADWTQEFAKQVDRLLPGGVSVTGVYVLSAAPARTALDQATLYLRAMADALRVPEPFAALIETSEAPRYVVHVCANSGKTSARSVSHVLEASRTSAAAAELRGGANVVLRKVTAAVAIDESVAFARSAIVGGGDEDSVVERVVAALQPQLVPLAARVFAATAVSTRRGDSDVVQFLTSAQQTLPPREANLQAELLRGSFRGAISCVAYIASGDALTTGRDAVATAAAALKRDFLKSLLLRAELVAERWADAVDAPPMLSAVNGAVGTLAFPRRASLPWSSSLGACSHFPALLHVFRGEHELAVQSALEILSSSGDADAAAGELSFLEAEPVAAPPQQQSKRGSNAARSAPSTATGTPGAASSSTGAVLYIALAVLLALLAIVVQRVLL
ncbi:hypothetical protein PybrP1_003305 [[Pythium] brassicae (nom. inval.)]|nr:hypothetical protein PybrP1_003305 [[Pythium] brassicae (nom. inval.)]